jgi:signal transduction histidine kinase
MLIRDRLILAYLLPTAALLAALGVFLYAEVRATLEGELDRRLIAVAQASVGSLLDTDPRRLARLSADDEATRGRLRSKLESLRAATGARRVFIAGRSADGGFTSLVDTRPDVRFGQPLPDLEADRVELERVFAPPGQSASSLLFEGSQGTRYKNGYAPILHEGAVIGVLGVEGSAGYFDAVVRLRNVMIVAGLLALGSIVAVSAWVSRSITRPIGVLVEATRRFGAGDFGAEVQMARKDELRSLADAFNEMRTDLILRDRQMQMMLSGIAHEVRNPLGGMELFSGLLAEELAGEPERLKYVQNIHRELQYLNRVVGSFLDYARKKPLEWRRFDAREFVEEVTQLLGRDLSAEGVSLKIGAVTARLELTADREKVHRLLINLIRNAGQASKRGQAVMVEAREVAAPKEELLPWIKGYDAWSFVPPPPGVIASGWRALAVVDEGVGISAEKLEAIFEPFYTTKEKGSGLGLALMRKIIEEHGGGFAVASTARPGEEASRAVSEQELIDKSLGDFLGGASDEGWLGTDEGGAAPRASSARVPMMPLRASSTRISVMQAKAPLASGPRYGTAMVVLLPFKEELERAKVEIPEGWLG